VVATLWPVNDQSTAVLIAEFYRLLLTERQDPATALARRGTGPDTVYFCSAGCASAFDAEAAVV